MKKNNLIFISFYGFLGISLMIGYVYLDSTFGNTSIDIIPKPITNLHQEKIVEVELNVIYNIMTNVENFPIIMPKNILSVKINEQNNNTLIGEAEITEKGIKAKINFQQTLFPYEKQIIEITDGYAKGTVISQKFIIENFKTKIVTDVDLKFSGLLVPFLYFPESNLNHAMNTVINSFIIYAQTRDSTSAKIVDDLFREILFRPADNEALEYFSKLLEQNKMSEDDLKNMLLNSEERKLTLLPSEIKSINELKLQTKEKINIIYQELLRRNADDIGMVHFGSMLESGKMSEAEIQNQIFYSSEGISLRYQKVGVSVVDQMFLEVFDRNASQEELDEFVPMILDETFEEEEFRLYLYSLK